MTSRGTAKAPIFHTANDRQHFIRLLGKTIARHDWRCLSYVLMDNHFHLLVRTPVPNLGRGMQWLKGRYVRGFNDRHDRWGALFGGRFHSTVVKTDPHVIATFAYIALNPVRAGLARAPEDYPWSAHRTLLGVAAPGFVDIDLALSFFGDNAIAGRDGYRDFIENIKRV